MDDLDREILAVLRRDARTPFTEIADRVGTSEGTVRNRVERMTEDGIIERFTVETRRGTVRAMVEVRLDGNVDTAAVAERIAGWEAVDIVWEVSDAADLVLVVDAPEPQRLNGLVSRARGLDEVQRTETRLILDERRG